LESADNNRKEKQRSTNSLSIKSCRFGVSDDGTFISTGDDKGRILLFDISQLLSSEGESCFGFQLVTDGVTFNMKADDSQRKGYSTTSFAKLEHKRANRITDPKIRATCFGFGCDNLLATSAEYIWRWQYVPTSSLNGVSSPMAVMNSPPPVPLNSPPAPSSK